MKQWNPVRLAALAGVVFAILTVAGNGSIGDFPDGDSPLAKIVANDTARHADIARGGALLYWAALFFAIFGTALWARVRGSVHPFLAGAVLVGAAVEFAQELGGAGTYSTLGALAGKHTVAPAALQAVHIDGAGGGLVTGSGGLALMLLAVGAAGLAGETLPRWLAWTALPLGLLQLTPVGFFAGLVFLLWAAATGVVLAVKPAGATPAGVSQRPIGTPGSA